jgi:hypothetical protein
MKHKALDRAGRKLTIVTWFAIRIQHNNMTYATSYEVARGLGLSASGKLRAILREMVDDGTLQAKEMDKQGRWKGSGYMLADGTYSRPRRTIQLTRNGKQLGQLEMKI